MKKTRLKEAVIAITYKCNSFCQMCNIWKIKEHPGELVAQDFLNLPMNLKDINISGGEPFLRKDLKEIIIVIKERCPSAKIIISSNGFATNIIISQMQEIIEIMPNIGVAISIDGIGEVHNKIRGIAGGYEKALKTIYGLKKIGVKNLKISFTIGEYNASELLVVYVLCQELKTELSLTVVHSSENYFGKENKINNTTKIIEALNWLIRKELANKKFKNWARAYFAYGAREFIRTGKRILPDYSGELSVFINPQGEIYPCDVSKQVMGNLKKLIEIENLKKPILNDCQNSWMVCTARQAIRKHFVRVIYWIVTRKFLGVKI